MTDKHKEPRSFEDLLSSHHHFNDGRMSVAEMRQAVVFFALNATEQDFTDFALGLFILCERE